MPLINKPITGAKRPDGSAVTWADVRHEYVSGAIDTLRELSEKYGISHSTLMKRSAKGKWESARKDQAEMIVAEAQKSLVLERAKVLEEFNEADLKVAKALRAQVATHIAKAQTSKHPLPAKDLRALAGTASEAQRIGRLALGVPTDNHGLSNPAGGPVDVNAVPSLQDFYATVAMGIDGE